MGCHTLPSLWGPSQRSARRRRYLIPWGWDAALLLPICAANRLRAGLLVLVIVCLVVIAAADFPGSGVAPSSAERLPRRPGGRLDVMAVRRHRLLVLTAQRAACATFRCVLSIGEGDAGEG